MIYNVILFKKNYNTLMVAIKGKYYSTFMIAIE